MRVVAMHSKAAAHAPVKTRTALSKLSRHAIGCYPDLILGRKQQPQIVVDRPFHREQPAAGAQAFGRRRIVEHDFDGAGERGDVADRHERAEPAVVENLSRAARAGGADHGGAARQHFDQDIAQTFIARGEHEHCGTAHEGEGIVSEPGHLDVLGDAELHCQIPQGDGVLRVDVGSEDHKPDRSPAA
jgi:hypothetical protein